MNVIKRNNEIDYVPKTNVTYTTLRKVTSSFITIRFVYSAICKTCMRARILNFVHEPSVNIVVGECMNENESLEIA